MAIYVKAHLNQNVNNRKSYGKYYGRAVYTDEVGIEKLAEDIAGECTLTRADILAVLSALGPAIRRELNASHRVVLPYVGSFKAHVTTEGAESLAEFDASSLVKRLSVRFIPETKIEQGHRINELLRGARVAGISKLTGEKTGGSTSGGSNSGDDDQPEGNDQP
jgi:predicted histone-like DNA-binding protein